jgi:selenocysteine-specific elongation factor
MTVVVGTAGHIDHGKTTLLRALTGIDADRLPEERRRGMTIDVGYAHLRLDDGRELDFVDVPGHERLIGNMLVGVGEIDAAMLVVAADDGPRAQTLEHLALLDAMAIRHGLVAITKTDLASPERTEAVIAETRRHLDGTSLAGAPLIAVSAVNEAGLELLRAALDRLGRDVLAGEPPDAGSGSRLAIDRVFAIKGRGLIATGTLRGHPLIAGTALRLVPGDRTVRVREVQVHGHTVDAAGPGRTAVNLAGVAADAVERGMVLTDDPRVRSTDRWLVVLSTALPDRGRVRLHLGTAALDAGVGRGGRDAIELADGRSVAILRLPAPVAVSIGDRFVLRRGSGVARIVGGVVIDDRAARGLSRRRQTVERVRRLAVAVEGHDDREIDGALTDLHGYRPRDAAGENETLATDVQADLRTEILAAVGAGPIGLTEARSLATRLLRRRVSIDRTDAEAVGSAIVGQLVSGGQLERAGTMIGKPGATRVAEPTADPSLVPAMDRLERSLDQVAPPSLRDTARAVGCPPEGIRELERTGRIVVLEPDLAYATTTFRRLAGTAVAMADSEPLTPAGFRDATGTSRRYVLAILSELDRRAILRRTPDGHVPGPRSASVERMLDR